MNFKIFKYYVIVCRLIKIKPSFEGLDKFEKYYHWECENNGRYRLGKDDNKYV